LQISVMDVSGKMMVQQESHETRTQISLKNFSEGIYLVNVINGDELTTKKISVY